jgi:hypothetical protein
MWCVKMCKKALCCVRLENRVRRLCLGKMVFRLPRSQGRSDMDADAVSK